MVKAEPEPKAIKSLTCPYCKIKLLTFKVKEHDCNSHIGVCESCYELNPHCLKIFKKVPEVKTPEESSFFEKIGFSDNGVMLLFLFVFFLWFFDSIMKNMIFLGLLVLVAVLIVFSPLKEKN